jgi:acyl-CoA thioester hydrolase
MSAEDPFVYRLRVRFAECDPQKVAFNGVYGLYIDLAVFEFLRAMGFGESLVKGPLDYQVVKQTVEWAAPARFDQVVEISVWAKHLGNTSFSIATQFRIAGDHQVIATGETIYVLVDSATLTKRPLPPDFRAALERGVAGQCVDHADITPRPRPTLGR